MIRRLASFLSSALLLSGAGFLLATAQDAGAPPAVPRLTHPGTGQTLYFVLADRFANGDPTNDTGGLPGGPDDHGFDPTRISHYQGGDFAGLIEKLDYLKSLGVTGIWVTPPFKNKPVQAGTAGYHGYWITDFTQIDPHLGTNADYRRFIDEAHARGIRVYMDIIVNHTADVIGYRDGNYDYVPLAERPDRDTRGNSFTPHEVAWNGVEAPNFPELSVETSFAYVPVVPPEEATIKHPTWLNDLTLYHNRGSTTFTGENSLYGDFAGLDDLYTEHPRVVQGFIEIYEKWISDFGIDGFRIDTAKHVNLEFWQAFSPAIRAHARKVGRPDFISFGEVYSEEGDAEFLSEFSSDVSPIDTTLDFGFFAGAREFVSQEKPATALVKRFHDDDFYTDHDSNVHSTVTFLGNHDAGRFAWFLEQDNPDADDATLLQLARLGHGLMFLVRGQPTVYYGDEQGMIGTGNDMRARETMFPGTPPLYRDARLLGTDRTGADDKFDSAHPLYRLIAALAELRKNHPALTTGAMITRETDNPHLFAVSRIDRNERIEYLAVFNNSRTEELKTSLPVDQPAGATLAALFDSRSIESPSIPGLTVSASGHVSVELEPMAFAVWRAGSPLPARDAAPTVRFAHPGAGDTLTFDTYESYGQTFAHRIELRAEVDAADALAEVTFLMVRSSQPGQYEYLGTDDAPPYRVFWRPSADLTAEDTVSFVAVVDDLRGHRATARIDNLKVAETDWAFGVRGAESPRITRQPARATTLAPGSSVFLNIEASGTEPLEYAWLRDGAVIPGETTAKLKVSEPGAYTALVRNRVCTVVSRAATVSLSEDAALSGRIEHHPNFASAYVQPRTVDIWLPPGYDAAPAARYPVIYMHDGQNLFNPEMSYGGQSWEVDQAMGRLIRERGLPGAIIVGIWNTGMNRSAEYMPQKPAAKINLANTEDPVTRNVKKVHSDAYLSFLVEELKPFVDEHYRTYPDREHTFVMGSSMGGLISVYALAEYPEIFGGAACLSTHWPAGDGIVIDYLAEHLPPPGHHRIYFDYGTETLDALYEPYQRRMDTAMRRAGYTEGKDWQTRKFPGAEHSEVAWRKRVEIPLTFLLGIDHSTN